MACCTLSSMLAVSSMGAVDGQATSNGQWAAGGEQSGAMGNTQCANSKQQPADSSLTTAGT